MSFKIPTKVKLTNGEEFDISAHAGLSEAIQTILKDTVKIEKDKVYGTLEEYRTNLLKVTDTLKEVSPALQTLASMQPSGLVTQEQIDAAKRASQASAGQVTTENVTKPLAPPTVKDIRNNPLEQMVSQLDPASVEAHLSGLFKGVIDTALGPLVSKLEKMEQKEVSQYIDKVRAENANSSIVEMIQGNTIEEVNSSLATAKGMFAKYFPTAPATPPAVSTTEAPASAPSSTPQASQPLPASPAPQVAPPSATFPGTATPTVGLPATDFKTMSMSEFAEIRDKEFQKLQRSVG